MCMQPRTDKQASPAAPQSESDFNSAERVIQYLKPEPEAADETAPEVAAKMHPDWPQAGAISVAKLTMRYRPGMPLVLKGLSFEVRSPFFPFRDPV